MRFTGENEEYLEVLDIDSGNSKRIEETATSELRILWFVGDTNELVLDSVKVNFPSGQLICLTEFNHVKVIHLTKAKLIKWNKPFFCVLLHDSEVSCRGLLFYGAAVTPILNLREDHIKPLHAVWEVLEKELLSKDAYQLEMLQMLLKRILILCTRFYKDLFDVKQLDDSMDLMRHYHFLVEQHFRTKHQVADYAELLSKSPKTLANTFKKLNLKSPLRFIQERLALEARRLLYYSDKSISEIGYDLGFEDVQSFSRFFKKECSISPNQFRKEL